jgi:2-dehydropantoate 2-reductase
MKVVIVGAGAMGCLFATLLHRAGVEACLLERSDESVEAISHHGILLEDNADTHAVKGISITQNAASIGHAEYVMFLVKAFDTEQAAVSVAPCVGPGTVIVTLQNGIGNVERLSEDFPLQSILAGTTAHGATLLGPGHVRHAGSGETLISSLRLKDRTLSIELCHVFEMAGIKTRIVDDMQMLLWGKLLVNIGINPLAAVLDINNGRLLDFENVRHIMRAAVREGVAVAAAKDIFFNLDEQVSRVEDICRATQNNICSMLQDLRAGRKTEIDYLNGAVMREARALRVPVPVNSMLTDLVRAKQMLASTAVIGN